MNKQKNAVYNRERIIKATVLLFKALEFVTLQQYIIGRVPDFVSSPNIYIIFMGVIWAIGAVSFTFNLGTRIWGTIISIMTLVILSTSTFRGLMSEETFVMSVLSIGFYLLIISGAFLVGSEGVWCKFGIFSHTSESKNYYLIGRMIAGLFFFIVGWVHFYNMANDVEIMGGFPHALFWVIFVGFCWFAVSASFWTQLMTKTSALLACVLIVVITLMIKLKSFHPGDIWKPILEIFVTL